MIALTSVAWQSFIPIPPMLWMRLWFRLGSFALPQLAFLKESGPNFPWVTSKWEKNKGYEKKIQDWCSCPVFESGVAHLWKENISLLCEERSESLYCRCHNSIFFLLLFCFLHYIILFGNLGHLTYSSRKSSPTSASWFVSCFHNLPNSTTMDL